MKRHIPNMITLLNLVSGFTALVFLLKGNSVVASWLVALAMVFDFADGMAAKLLRAGSETGKQLDSLADIVSFGIVPGVIVYSVSGDTASEWMRIFFASLLPVFAAIRLARFNAGPEQKEVFIGLPSPAAALAIISLVLSSQYNGSFIAAGIIDNNAALFIYSAITSLLMVVPLRMMSLKVRSLRIRENLDRYILVILSLTALIVLGFGGIFWIIPFYVLISLTAGLRL
ncbi:MAG: CDP-diacylglycerol--serine O-phosphatidyltransferase [Bacteroidales bacterium]